MSWVELVRAAEVRWAIGPDGLSHAFAPVTAADAPRDAYFSLCERHELEGAPLVVPIVPCPVCVLRSAGLEATP